jgi:hypothetical protein
MGSFKEYLRLLTARLAFGALAALTVAPEAQAQWLLPFGAAPPGEIVQRLRAQGFVLAGPLYRRNSVYLADVNGGRERLIIDAWSGEILQRFVVRHGQWRPGYGGEFAQPLPPGVVGPPPTSEFLTDRPARAFEERIRPKGKPKSTATSRQPAQSAPEAQDVSPARPENADNAGANPTAAKGIPAALAPAPVVPPPTAATPAAPMEAAKPTAPISNAPATQSDKPPTASSSAEAKPPAAPSVPTVPATEERPQGEQPKRSAPTQAQTQSASTTAPVTAKPPVPVPSTKSNDKSKVNDVPVMPLD